MYVCTPLEIQDRVDRETRLRCALNGVLRVYGLGTEYNACLPCPPRERLLVHDEIIRFFTVTPNCTRKLYQSSRGFSSEGGTKNKTCENPKIKSILVLVYASHVVCACM
jgi:hypothetical protein